MFIKNIKKAYTRILGIKNFLSQTEIKPTYFFISGILSLGAASLEGMGWVFSIPLLKGIIQMNFGFMEENKIMQFIMHNIFHITYRPQIFIFVFLVCAVLLTMVASNIMCYFANITLLFRLRAFSDRLRRLIFDRYVSFGKLFFDQHNLGYLHNILINFTEQIAFEFNNLQNAFNQFFSLLIYLIIMIGIDWRLTILVTLTLPVLTRSVHWLIERIKKTSIVYTASSKQINENIFNVLSCIPLVKIYAWDAQEKERFASLSKNLRLAEYSLDKKNQLIHPINEIIVLIIVFLLVSVMSFIVIKEKSVQVSSFLVFALLLKRASNNFYFINIIKTSFANLNGPISEIAKIFDNKDKFFVLDGQKQFTGLSKNIVINNLSFSYIDKVQVLKDISFTIEKGKLTALVGPSGVGKTTLINLILRFYECPPSTIFIDGIDIKEFTLDSLRKHMALVGQDTFLFNDTFKNNITYGLDREITQEELIDIAHKARLYDFIMQLPDKFDTYVGDRGVKLSGGEKQRVAIARALLKDAEILILDEATSSLDSKTEKLIQEAIDEAIKDRTAIVIAHRLSTIKNADKIIVIENGKFVEEGNLSELLDKREKFYEYWQEQKFY
jgi:ABC-type multidrug transport system fused ATPase/permease subunit